MKLTQEQKVVYDGVMHWVKDTGDGQPYQLVGGYAGTGKTFLLSEITKQLDPEKTIICTPTGKSASVLAKKLNGSVGVTTIHKALYKPVPPSRAKVDDLTEQVEADPNNHKLISALEEAIREFDNAQLEFAFTGSIGPGSLVCVDEGSMLAEYMRKDVLATGAKLLIFGDHGQLSPVRARRWFGADMPLDYALETVHRRALDNPITRLSMIIREEQRLPKKPTSAYKIIPASKIGKNTLAWANQVLVGKHVTRWAVNKHFRKAKFGTDVPVFPVAGDKLICIKNRRQSLPETTDDVVHLLNGVTATATEDAKEIFGDLRADVDYDGVSLKSLWLYDNPFLANYNRGHADIPWQDRRDMAEFDYGYAITVHKSQGSEYDNVVAIDDGIIDHDRDEKIRWLYTAVTRAKEKLVLGV